MSAPSPIERLFLGPWDFRSRVGFLVAIGLLCVATTTIGFAIVVQTNPDPDQFDQGAYIGMSRVMRDAWYPWYSDGTRNPLFPWLAARFLNPDAAGFFLAGKFLNVLLAVAGAAGLAGFFAGRMGPLAAFNATALCTLAVLLPLGTYFGAEVLFYVLFFALWVVAARLLRDNPLWLYAVLGLLAGLCWLAKPSATPFLALFVAFNVLKIALRLLPGNLGPWWRTPRWSPRRFLIGVVLFSAIFLAMIAPRLVHAHRTWGVAFYSLPSYWFWMDDWETCVTRYYDCRPGTLANLPPDEQPTMAGYFRRHSVSDAVSRLVRGSQRRLEQFFFPEDKWRVPFERGNRPRRLVQPHRGWYVIGLGLVTLGLAFFARRHLRELPSVAWPVLLGLGAFAGYTVATGWYLPTGPGHRFILALYIPVVWMLVQGGEQLRQVAHSAAASRFFLGAHGILFLLLVVRLTTLVVDPRFEKIIYTF